MAGDSDDRFFAHVQAMLAPLMRDGTVAAIGREAVKDVRSTLHEVFFGHPERNGEIGSPLNPLYTDLAEAKDDWQKAMTPSEIARDDRPHPSNLEQSRDQDRGHSR